MKKEILKYLAKQFKLRNKSRDMKVRSKEATDEGDLLMKEFADKKTKGSTNKANLLRDKQQGKDITADKKANEAIRDEKQSVQNDKLMRKTKDDDASTRSKEFYDKSPQKEKDEKYFNRLKEVFGGKITKKK